MTLNLAPKVRVKGGCATVYRLAVMRQSIRPACAISSSDRKYMQQALELAKRGLGRTQPNPAVGCVILKDGKVGQIHKAACSRWPRTAPTYLCVHFIITE